MNLKPDGTASAIRLRCAGCGHVIGVYEPLVHVVGGIAHRTSRAADPDLVWEADCFHVECCDRGISDAVSVA